MPYQFAVSAETCTALLIINSAIRQQTGTAGGFRASEGVRIIYDNTSYRLYKDIHVVIHSYLYDMISPWYELGTKTGKITKKRTKMKNPVLA